MLEVERPTLAIGPEAEQQGNRRKTVHFSNHGQRTPAIHLRKTQRQQAP